MNTAAKIIAVDPTTGSYLRDASEWERTAYRAQPVTNVAFLGPVTINGALIMDVTPSSAPDNQGDWRWL